MMDLETGRALVTPPASEPVTVLEAQERLRVDQDDDWDVIDDLIVAAREWVEEESWRALVTQTWDIFYSGFPPGGDAFIVPKSPLQSVTSITYVDTDGASQTLSASLYQVDPNAERGVIRAAYGESWPGTRVDTLNAVTVRIVAGYGGASAVPRRLKQAMLLLIGHWYANRESVVVGTISTSVQQTVDSLIGLSHARAMVG